ncbi:MAG: glycogen debranching enzyme family protein [Planctomycetes bacterium]|nr:glycogen debranching enzyme family protein [Planctomycetota bacterium]
MGKKDKKDKEQDLSKEERKAVKLAEKLAKKTKKQAQGIAGQMADDPPAAAVAEKVAVKPKAAAKKAGVKKAAAKKSPALPAPITVNCKGHDLDHLLSLEWLQTNRLGAYSSSTVVGCNTRRYHGLLVAATLPPVGRMVALSSLMEWLDFGDQSHELGCSEFPGNFAPKGYDYVTEYRDDVAATTVFEVGPARLIKESILAEDANAVAVRYTLKGASGRLRFRPFAAMRDFHHLRTLGDPQQFSFEQLDDSTVAIIDGRGPGNRVVVRIKGGVFKPDPQWWSRFCYRTDIHRGQYGCEDIYCPGWLVAEDVADGQSIQITASLDGPVKVDFEAEVAARRDRLAKLAASVRADGDETAVRLAMAGDAFLTDRTFKGGPAAQTLLAGFHWFADWGRDAFISMPGLLLSTWQFGAARQVFNAFLRHLSEGMIPSRYDDYASAAHYNSVDASLWFIVAADRYLEASGDDTFWTKTLLPACREILDNYRKGTRYDIHADADGLLYAGAHNTQLTWMDACQAGNPITPRHGKPVEVNALWYCAHRMLAERCKGVDDRLARKYDSQAKQIGESFAKAFWHAENGCLHDCITDGFPDAAIRPNQILAVSLPFSPLSAQQQAGVVKVVQEQLLTPFGLRSLSPLDSRYRRGYGGSWESRDKAYHQGTVWAWLIGPFIEAYLRVNGPTRQAVAKAREFLEPFDAHLAEAGLGYVSEIFDGDQPHEPKGCIAQAWSVGELLRAKLLVAQAAKQAGG